MTADGEPPPPWPCDVPEPEAAVIAEDGRYRAELTNYVQRGGRVKDLRVRGPVRATRREARRDAAELRRAALRGGASDPALFHVRARRKELEAVRWKERDLVGPDMEEEDSRERELERRRQEEEQKRQRDQSHDTRAVMHPDKPPDEHKPVGPNWQKPGSLVQLPNIAGASWLIHEKQDASGKYRAWLYFDAVTGKYYRQKDSGTGYIQTGVPHDPQDFPISVRIGSANISSQVGKKLNMAVLLPELHKTGFLLKQPLEFLDRPASLFVLCDGLRNTATAAEFCAKKLHTLLLPKLSWRATEWEDFELVDVVRDTVEALDGLLLESPTCLSGCSLALGLLAGTRLVLGALGGVRCLLCRPPAAKPRRSATVAANEPAWAARLVAGGEAHTAACEEERLRVESAGRHLYDARGGARLELSAGSARPAVLAAVADERERLLLQVARAANPFAALGVAPADLRLGAAAIRRTFRRRSLIVHPDKVDEALRKHAVAIFAKLEASASAVEAMLQVDLEATVLLAEVDAAHDAGRLVSDPAAAAQLLGVLEGCSAGVAKKAVEEKFHAPLSRLQSVCPRDVERALRTLEVAEESLARGTPLWAPPEPDEAVRVTRALGCKDLKAPVPLLSSGLAAECVALEPGGCIGVALLSDGLQSVGAAEAAHQLAQHAPSRPRAAALRLALQGAARGPRAVAGAVVCAYFETEIGGGASSSGGPPVAKRARMGGAAAAPVGRARISHILLRWAGLKGEDEFVRPGLEPPLRTQAAAERELLELLEELLVGDPKTLGARFKAQVLKRSECASALNVPYADLGWIEQGGAEPPLEAAAFASPVGGLSDVVLSSRGAHLMYRLA